MNRSLAFVIAVACVVFSAMPVQAADVPARTNPPSFYKAPWELPFSWTGFYTGINGGYAWGHSSWSDPAVGTDSGNFNISGGLVGGQLGYNWQTGPVVLGIETDADWMSVKGNTAGLGGVCPADGGGQCQVQQSWVGTTRARVGYAFTAGCPMSRAASPTATSKRCSQLAPPPAPMLVGPPAPVWKSASTVIGAPRSNISISISAPPPLWAPRPARPL